MLSSIAIVFVLMGLLCLVIWQVHRRAHKRAEAFKTALESSQKKLDLQTSRINILTRSLPNLQTTVRKSEEAETWTVLALDEARALLKADGASFWRINERENGLNCVLARGEEARLTQTAVALGTDSDPLVNVTKSRLPHSFVKETNQHQKLNYLIVPLLVGGNLWCLFRFVRFGGEPLHQREGDLVEMFLGQLALALENKDMIANREKFYLELVQTLADILDSRDASSKGQTRRVRALARGIARELDMPEQFIYYLEFAALMHDIGKIAIDEQLLKKPGKLSPQEFEVIKQHPELGHKILAHISLLAPVAPMVLYHQEWFNGKGYPEGLSGEEIPLGARIVAVLDAWGAMTSVRPWRPALTEKEAVAEIKKGAGTQFDPKVVEAFLTVLEKQAVPVAQIN